MHSAYKHNTLNTSDLYANQNAPAWKECMHGSVLIVCPTHPHSGKCRRESQMLTLSLSACFTTSFFLSSSLSLALSPLSRSVKSTLYSTAYGFTLRLPSATTKCIDLCLAWCAVFAVGIQTNHAGAAILRQ